MTEDELIKAAKKALEKEAKLPAKTRWNNLVKSGLIDEQGRVIRDKMGRHKKKKKKS